MTSAGFTIVLRCAQGLVGQGGASSYFDGFLLMWVNFKFEGVLCRSDSRHSDRVDSLLECATKQAVMTVAQWHNVVCYHIVTLNAVSVTYLQHFLSLIMTVPQFLIICCNDI
jgi:hypothetical protein